MKENPKCYIMVGLPGTGKSTYCDLFLPNIRRHSSDDIIEQHALSIGKSYNEVFDKYIKTASGVFERDLLNSIQKGESFVVDRTNISYKSRKRLYQFLERTYFIYDVIIVEMIVSPETHMERLNARNEVGFKTISNEVVNSFRNKYVTPSTDEFHNITEIIRYDAESAIKTNS